LGRFDKDSDFLLTRIARTRLALSLPFNGGTLSLFLIAKSDVREGFLHFPS
jgi:hypothetical protein